MLLTVIAHLHIINKCPVDTYGRHQQDITPHIYVRPILHISHHTNFKEVILKLSSDNSRECAELQRPLENALG